LQVVFPTNTAHHYKSIESPSSSQYVVNMFLLFLILVTAFGGILMQLSLISH